MRSFCCLALLWITQALLGCVPIMGNNYTTQNMNNIVNVSMNEYTRGLTTQTTIICVYYLNKFHKFVQHNQLR